MTACIVTIGDSEASARTLDRYLRCFLDSDVESHFMTYGRTLLSGALLRRTDLFILDLFRQDNLGFRAEAIFAAEKWLSSGHRVLIVSGAAVSRNLNCAFYWDLSAPDELRERIKRVLREPPALASEIDSLRLMFQEYYRPASDRHKERS